MNGQAEDLLLQPVFLNTIPKSGTHLVKQILSGVPGLIHHEGDEFYEGRPNQIDAQRARLGKIGAGRLATGHVYYSAEWAAMLDAFGFKRLFLYRDPRDVVVSLVYFYTLKLPNHPGYEHLGGCLHSNRDRILAVITGFTHEELDIPDISAWYRTFMGWSNDRDTLLITFENLIQTAESRRETIRSVLRYLVGVDLPADVENQIVSTMETKVDPATSPTFRQGQIGAWRNEFDDTTRALFKILAGDLLIELGYEADHDW